MLKVKLNSSKIAVMAVEEFQFKIARSKDLPLSWFELVLRPEKFREHLKTLETNPNGTMQLKISTGCPLQLLVHEHSIN